MVTAVARPISWGYPGMVPKAQSTGTRSITQASEQPRSWAPLPARFEMKRELGSGGGGRVVAAYDRLMAREVAIKLLPLGRPTLLLAEARAAARLQHVNVVAVHEVSPDDGYIVMDLMSESLDARIAREGTLSVGQLFPLAQALLSALDAAHSANIIHRDVKPANVLFGADGVARLADFGTALTAEEAAAGGAAGTRRYMAPEQASGSADHRSDVYGAGATLFAALTGVAPSEVHNDRRGLAKALKRSTRNQQLVRVLLQALDPQPSSRWPSALTFSKAMAKAEKANQRRSVAAAFWLAACSGLAMTGVWIWIGRSSGPAPLTVAVLPAQGDRVLRGAIPTLQVHALSTYAPVLRVVPPLQLEGAPQFDDTDQGWRDAARALGATYVLYTTVVPAAVVQRLETVGGALLQELRRDKTRETVAEVVPEMTHMAVQGLLTFQASAPEEKVQVLGQGLLDAIGRHDFLTASAYLAEAEALVPHSADVAFYRALVSWWRAAPHQQIVEDMAEAQRTNPSGSRSALLSGLMALVHGHYRAALDILTRADSATPNDPSIRYGVFEALYHSGRAREAVAAFDSPGPGLMAAALPHAADFALAQEDAALMDKVLQQAVAAGYSRRPLMEAQALWLNGSSAEGFQLLEAHAGRSDEVGWLARAELAGRYLMLGRSDAAEALASAEMADIDRLLMGVAAAYQKHASTTEKRNQELHVLDGLRLLRSSMALLRAVSALAPHADPGVAAELQWQLDLLDKQDVRMEVATVLLADRRHDDFTVGAGLLSEAAEVRAVSEGLVLNRAGYYQEAALSFLQAASLSIDGKLQPNELALAVTALRQAGTRDAAQVCRRLQAAALFQWSVIVVADVCAPPLP